MQSKDVERLKIAAEQFYLDMHMDLPLMSDSEYDKLAYDYEQETGKSVKDLIDWNSVGSVEHIMDLKPLPKIQVKDNDLKKAVKEWVAKWGIKDYYLNLKYDGCGIRAYYKDGVLCKVLTTPDEMRGLVKTNTLRCLFPQEVGDKTIESICGELVVDPTIFGHNSRNKANGLVNSKDKLDEIINTAMVRAYRVTYIDEDEYDYKRQSSTLMSLPWIYGDDNRVVFKPADRFGIDEIPSTSINNNAGEPQQADGVVLYCEQGFQAFKFYYNDFQDVVVTSISYKVMKTGKLYPTLHFKRTIIDGKGTSKCAGGSLDLVRAKKMGVGSRIRVILSNSTIPKVLQVLEPSEDYQIPEELMSYVN